MNLLENIKSFNANFADSVKRNALLESFLQKGFPAVKNEVYKYTNIDRKIKEWEVSQTVVASSTECLDAIIAEHRPAYEHHLLVTVNGKLLKSEINAADADKFSIAPILTSDLNVEPDSKRDGLSALALAISPELQQVKVTEGSQVNLPIVYLNILQGSTKGFHSQAIAFELEKNAELCVYEVQINQNTVNTFSNEAVMIICNEESKLDWVRLQNIPGENARITHTVADVFGKALFRHFNISVAGELIRNNIDVRLKGEFSDTHLYGANLAGVNTHIDNSTLIRHLVPNCESTENYKNISGNGGFTIFNGKIFVEKDAQKTNAYQSNKNLLISENARAYSKPELEIYADDVKCSHGSTTGRLDENALFYLRARGLSEKSAKNLLMQAFLKDALEELQHEEIKEGLTLLLENKLTELQKNA